MTMAFRRLAVTVGLVAGLCGVTAVSTMTATVPTGNSSAVASGVGTAPPPYRYNIRKGAYYTDRRGTAADKCAFAGDEGRNDRLWRDWYCWKTASTIAELWVQV
jgi:hypothetical protein